MKWNKKSKIKALLIILILSIFTVYQNINSNKLKQTIAKNDNKRSKTTIKLIENEEAIRVERITMNSKATLSVGSAIRIYTTVYPSDATNKTLRWTSSNQNIAIIDSSTGIVKGVAVGTVTITAYSVDNPEIKATCELTVKEVSVNNLVTNYNELSLNIGETRRVVATISPSNATNKNVKWTSNNTRIATVDGNGNIRAITPGTAIITAASVANPNIKRNINITVKEISVTNITVNKTVIDLNRGSSERIIATVQPYNAANKNLTWTSSNNGIATVDNTGNIRAIGIGTATITIRPVQNPSIKRDVIVRVKAVQVSTINTNLTVLEMNEGQTSKIYANVLPNNADNRGLIWKSSNPSIVTVDNNGFVKAIKYGTATITVTSIENKTISKAITVKVKEISITGFNTSVEQMELEIGEKKQIIATPQPANASNKRVSWGTSNTNIASVDGQGTVTGKKEGKVKITVYSLNKPSIKKSVTVTVTKPKPKDIRFSKSNLTLDVNASLQLEVELEPSTTEKSQVAWESSNKSVATISQNGTIHTLRPGTTTITAYIRSNTNIRAAMQVKVAEAEVDVSRIYFTKKTVTIEKNKKYKPQLFIEPPTATNKDIIWSTKNSDIATVNANGYITGLKEGETEITATSASNPNQKATITVKIIEQDEKTNVEEIKISEKEINLGVGTSFKIFANVAPTTAKNKEIEWKSKNEKIATVDANGIITGIKPGTTKIVVMSKDNESIQKEVIVNVKKDKIPVKNIVLAETINGNTIKINNDDLNAEYRNSIKYITVKRTDKISIKAYIAPDNATEQDVTWKSSNEKVAKVNNKGVVTILKKGAAKITATSVSEKYIQKSIALTIKEPVTGVSIVKGQDLLLGLNLTKVLHAKIEPSTASNKNVIWTTSNPEIVKIDQKGKITALKEGTATITVTSDENKNIKDELQVAVGQKIGNIYFLSTQGKKIEGDNIIESVVNTITNKMSNENSSIVVKSNIGKLALINTAEDGVCNFIKKQLQDISGKDKITLEYLIITLADEYHAGCYEKIINDKEIAIKNVVLKETNETYQGKNYFEYMKNIALKKGANVINTQDLSEGSKIALGNINIMLYNNQNIFKGQEEKCEGTIRNQIFSNSEKSEALYPFDGTIWYPGYTQNLIATNNSESVEFINVKTKKTYINNGYKVFQGNSKNRAPVCNEKTNSLALLIEITDNNGNARSYAYLPTSIENNGYPVQGTEQRTNYKTIESNKIIYGNGTTYAIRRIEKDDTIFFEEPAQGTVFKDVENKVSEQIAKDIGKENLTKIKIYQSSNYGYSTARNTLENLGLTDSNGKRLSSFYTIIEGNYTKYSNTEYIVWKNSNTFAVNSLRTFASKSPRVECSFTIAGGVACKK